jgi:hypothetical protein
MSSGSVRPDAVSQFSVEKMTACHGRTFGIIEESINSNITAVWAHRQYQYDSDAQLTHPAEVAQARELFRLTQQRRIHPDQLGLGQRHAAAATPTGKCGGLERRCASERKQP